MAQGEDFVTAPNGRRSDEIRSDIERTRTELDETLAALDAKLEPRQIGRDALNLVKRKSSAKADKLRQIAREHPLPTVAIGLGAGLLLGWRFRRSRGNTNGR